MSLKKEDLTLIRNLCKNVINRFSRLFERGFAYKILSDSFSNSSYRSVFFPRSDLCSVVLTRPCKALQMQALRIGRAIKVKTEKVT